MAEAAPRVLVVDDERFFREAIRDALLEAGIECETAGGALPARRLVEDRHIGVAVVDLNLPGPEGLELVREWRRDRPELRIILLAAMAEQEAVIEALRIGACDYLAKPLHEEELVLAVRRALESHGVESSWSALRGRLRTLESQVAEIAERAREIAVAERPAALAGHVARAVGAVLGAARTSFMLLDESGDSLHVAAATGSDVNAREMDAVRVGDGVAGMVLAARQPLLVEDIDADGRFQGRSARADYSTRSLVVAPVEGVDRALGVLCATDRSGDGAFGEDDLSLLRILALEVGALLGPGGPEPEEAADAPGETHPLDEDEPGDARLTDLAREICDAITAEVDPQRLLAAALRAVSRSLPAEPAALYLIDNESGELVCQGQCEGAGPGDRPRLPRGRGLTGAVLQTGWLVAADAPDGDPRYDAEVDTAMDGEVRPLLCVPLRIRGKVLGLMRAFPSDGVPASARTGELLTATLSAAVRNVLLYRSLLESIDEVAEARREGAHRGASPGPDGPDGPDPR